MPQGQIRKGFFFYFGLFVLLLISIFCICLVVMMFNPGKTVLWMQYFTGNDKILITKTTDATKTEINWSNVTSLEINCSYANVSVRKSAEYDATGLYIFNEAKGFAGASNAVPFSYDIYFEGSNKLKVDITEPNGFLYFSKKIDIILFADADQGANYSNLKLTVNTTDGNIDLGGSGAEGGQNLKLSEVVAKTTKGSIYINEKLDTANLQKLELTTTEGNIQSVKEINYGATGKGKGFSANCDTLLKTTSGTINFDAIVLPNKNLTIDCRKGNVAVDYINAENVNVRCFQGNYLLGKIYANLSYSKSEDSILAPNIVVDYIDGDFHLSAGDGQAEAEPDIDIKEIRGYLDVVAKKGTLKVAKAGGEIEVSSEGSLSTNITVAENNNSTKSVVSNSGSTTLSFVGNLNNTIVHSAKGKININITNYANFTASMFLNDIEQTNKIPDANISISHGLQPEDGLNPLTIRGDGTAGSLHILTNGNVSFNLVAKETLVD